MCRSMADIQSAMAEIRRGKKRKKKKETTGQKYNESSEVHHFQKLVFYLCSMELTLTLALMQMSHLQNKNKMVFRSKDLVLIKVLHQEKRLCRLMNDHTASLEITVNV